MYRWVCLLNYMLARFLLLMLLLVVQHIVSDATHLLGAEGAFASDHVLYSIVFFRFQKRNCYHAIKIHKILNILSYFDFENHCLTACLRRASEREAALYSRLSGESCRLPRSPPRLRRCRSLTPLARRTRRASRTEEENGRRNRESAALLRSSLGLPLRRQMDLWIESPPGL